MCSSDLGVVGVGPNRLHRTCVRCHTGVVLSRTEIEGLRRSAAMAPLSADAVTQVLQACEQMAREREQIQLILKSQLPPNWSAVRDALRRLSTIVGE